MSALIGAAVLVGLMAIPAAAGGVERYQVTTTAYHLSLGYGHTWTVESACGSLVVTGYQDVHNPDETISATESGGMISFHSDYVGGWAGNPYWWEGSFPVGGGTGTAIDINNGHYTFSASVTDGPSSTAYKNHGEYVAAMGGGADAAHSCIGMPVNSRQ